MQAAAVSLPLPRSPRRLATLGVSRRFVSGAVLTPAGVSSRTLIFVLEGAVAMSVLSPDGQDAILAVLGPAHAFGGPAEPETDVALGLRALGSVRASFVPGDALLAVTGNDPQLALTLARLAAARAAAVTEAAVCLRVLDAPGRIAWWLRQLARDHGVPTLDGRRVRLPITQSDLAAMAGCARETANRAITSLVTAGDLRIQRGRYVVRDAGWRPGAASR